MRFFLGDDNGFVKYLKISHGGIFAADSSTPSPEPSVVLRPAEGQGKECSIDRLAVKGSISDEMYLTAC